MATPTETVKKGPWLVKSGDRILGPYSTDDLSQMIRQKEVVVIDEIAAPQTRWQYLRDVPTFQKVVEETRRNLMHTREDTEVQGYTASVASKAEIEQTSTEGVIDFSEDTPSTPVKRAKDVPPAAPVATPSATPGATRVETPKAAEPVRANEREAYQAPVKSVMTPLAHHTYEDPEPELTLARPKRSRAPVIVGALVLILAVGFVLFSAVRKPAGESKASGENLETQASVAWKRGEFERALELYRALDREHPGQPLVAARLAMLMIKIESQTVEAKRVIASAQANAKDGESRAALAIASGLASLQTDDVKAAAAQFSSAGDNWMAQFDEGVAQGLLKNWDEAAKALQSAGDHTVAYLMLARMQMNAADANSAKGVGLRHDATESIDKALSRAPDFHQEAWVIGAYIDVVSGNTKQALKRVLQAIDIDPQQTSDHFHDPALTLDLLSWPKLLPYCQQIHSTLASKSSAALLGLCLAKANQLENASKLIEGEIMKDSSNASLYAVQAYLNLLSDRDDAASASLKLSSKNGTSRLAQILSARLCARDKQDACAEEGWSKLASEENPPIAALTGLAQIRESRGDASTASALLVKAESISPRYLPLLRIREDASR